MNSKAPAGYNLTDGGNGMVGYRHKPETKAKVSAKLKGRTFTAEHRAKIGIANTGRKCSDLVMANFRAANIDRIYTEEHRAKIGAAAKGRKHSEETKEKIRSAMMGNKNTLGIKYNRRKKTA